MGGYVYVFVSALSEVSIPDLMRVFKCISGKVLFEGFPVVKEQLGGALVVRGDAVRTAGDVTGVMIEECINRK